MLPYAVHRTTTPSHPPRPPPQAALALSPTNPGTLSALGYTAQLAGDPRAAMGHYHAALALRPDDPFTVDMLRLALQVGTGAPVIRRTATGITM